MPREKVTVVEVGLRDGLQMLPRVVPTEDKIVWLDAERASGVRRFEVASFVPPKLLPQMADAADVVRGGKTPARPHGVGSGAEPERRAAPRSKPAPTSWSCRCPPATRHSRANVRRTPDEMVAEVGRICAGARRGQPPGPGRCRHRHRLRLHDPGRGARGRGGADRRGLRRGRRRRDRARRYRRLCQPGAGSPPVRPGAGGCRRPRELRAFPRHPRHRPRQCRRRARRRHPLVRCLARRSRRLPAMRPARAATSRPKTSCSCWRPWASIPASTSTR